MMILFWDTETTGFFDDRLPPDHEAQPHIVQIAAQLCEEASGAPVAEFSLIVDPGVKDGVLIPEQAAAVHGITNARAEQFGCSPDLALTMFQHLYKRADCLCAYNVKFDRGVTEAAIARSYGRPIPMSKPMFCAMEAATPIVNLLPTQKMIAAGFNKPNAPKLEECVRHFFGEEHGSAHDAMSDVAACRRIYFHLKFLGVPGAVPA